MNPLRISFIGAGVMAEALIRGLLRQKTVTADSILASDVIPARLNALHGRYGISCTHDNRRTVEEGDIVILAVKPQNLAEVADQVKGAFRPQQTLLSIVAGATITKLSKAFQHEAVIRVMPNTPAQVGEGISVWTATEKVSQEHRDAAQAMLQGMGEELYLTNEKYIEMATALSASGPAYIFLVIEALTNAGVHLGLPLDTARTLAVQTVLGSAKLAKETGKHPAELKEMVSSPGGTTVEGLLALEEGKVRASFIKAVIAAYEKALKLGS
jgi:pyrroline-5-carboxylate reductase